MSLESYYNEIGNVVLRSEDVSNEPSIFVYHPKQSSKEFDSSLPNHTHPAFKLGETEYNGVLIGKYTNTAATNSSNLCSLPNKNPVPSSNVTYNGLMNRLNTFGRGITSMTIADHGLLTLIAHKNKYTGHGNTMAVINNSLPCADYRDGNPWQNRSATMYVGDILIYKGYEYICTTQHIANAIGAPDLHPGYWRKGRKIGGTHANYGYTLTGSGPLNWYLLDDIANEADLSGNVACWYSGIQIVNGQIQILDENAAADPNSSASWKAILPSTGGDNNYELVSPTYDDGVGTGTIHYIYKNGLITLVDRVPGDGEYVAQNENYKQTDFQNIAIEMTNSVPTILYELGLAPLPNTTVDGRIALFCRKDNVAYKVCSWERGNANYDGIGSLRMTYTATTNTTTATRSRAFATS